MEITSRILFSLLFLTRRFHTPFEVPPPCDISVVFNPSSIYATGIPVSRFDHVVSENLLAMFTICQFYDTAFALFVFSFPKESRVSYLNTSIGILNGQL